MVWVEGAGLGALYGFGLVPGPGAADLEGVVVVKEGEDVGVATGPLVYRKDK